jgi:hypothetical protein
MINHMVNAVCAKSLEMLKKEGISLPIPLDGSHLLLEFLSWFIFFPEACRVDMLILLVPSPVDNLGKGRIHVRSL